MSNEDLFRSDSLTFPATQAQAWRRWHQFSHLATRYGAERNRVIPGHPFVSRLSPAVRCRLILESELVEAVLKRAPMAAVEKFVQEVLWRTYWKAWLENRPEVWAHYREELAHQKTGLSPFINKRVEEVLAGRSGVAIMDRFTHELIDTGYLHNHARMWWASFWIHVEKLPWVIGADFFYRHLLDADPASNTLSWRWVAGLQTRGKTYLVRRSNLEKYCAPEYLEDPIGLEVLDDNLAQPHFQEEWLSKTAPKPAVRSESAKSSLDQSKLRWGWWLHGEDLHVASAAPFLPDHAPKEIVAFLSQDLCRLHGLSPLRMNYMTCALQDGLDRAHCLWKLPETSHVKAVEGALAAAISSWARGQRLEEIWCFRPFVGPLRDQLEAIEKELAAAGVRLRLVTRPGDLEMLPLAHGGYFGFWEKARRRKAISPT